MKLLRKIPERRGRRQLYIIIHVTENKMNQRDADDKM